jgi:hypothetical protein
LINVLMNPVNVVLLLPVVITLVTSLFVNYNRERVVKNFFSIINNIEFISALLIALFLTKGILFDQDNAFFNYVRRMLPTSVKASLEANDIYTYLCIAFIVLIIVVLIIKAVTYPLYRNVLEVIASGIYRVMSSMSSFSRKMVSFLCSVPKAAVSLICMSFILYFFSYYFTVPGLSRWIDDSAVLQAVYKSALKPVVNSDIAKKIPVIINDRFSNPAMNQQEMKIAQNIRDTLDNYNIKVIQYFNGVTLNDAVKSNQEIDNLARELAKGKAGDYEKARAIYKWITKNIKYDYNKAKEIAVKTQGMESGTIICYETRKGICFDYSSLFISMCRANGIKVRLVTGLGYSGLAWGDHAWNQFYDSGSDRWVNVDCTFGVSGNYFDTSKFSLDHKGDRVQEEW